MDNKKYDSGADTVQHILAVRNLLARMVADLEDRSLTHDRSKLESPEKEMFDEFTPKLRSLTYGSDAYKETLKEMGVALDHHYKMNSHHPEHYANGVNGMTLMDVMEMVADWKAASMRHADGDFHKSLHINKERFGISEQLFEIILNTVGELGW